MAPRVLAIVMEERVFECMEVTGDGGAGSIILAGMVIWPDFWIISDKSQMSF
ncbi:MAG: hypothetical protein WBJ41_13015 [Chromatiaceae bacterium]